MRVVTPEYRAALRGPHKTLLGVEFTMGNQTYRLNNGDTEFTHSGNVYSPTYLKNVSDIEMTSAPKINEVDITLDAVDGIFAGLILSENWMNRKLTIRRFIIANGAVAGASIIFVGLLGEFDLIESSRELDIKASSVWKDFEKTAGIRSNTASQQRFYPGDTALDHAAAATKDTYWGKEKPASTTPSTSGGGGTKFGNINTVLV